MRALLLLPTLIACISGQWLNFVPWRRLSKSELYFYNGVDGKPEQGWDDTNSIGVNVTHNAALRLGEGGPAEGLAKLDFFSQGGDWRIVAKGEGYKATPDDEVILRIRAEKDDTTLLFYAGEDEGVDSVTSSVSVAPGWRQIHLSLDALAKPITLKRVGLRKESDGKGRVYVAYMYLKVDE